jgi:hypothetical protein
MRRIKPRMHGMRTDFNFSTKQVHCPNSSWIGYSTSTAKPGSWITFRPDSDSGAVSHGRVIGSVSYSEPQPDGIARFEDQLMVCTLLGSLDNPAMRWLDPALVTACYPTPPRAVLEWICGEWSDPQAIVDAMHRGFPTHHNVMEARRPQDDEAFDGIDQDAP